MEEERHKQDAPASTFASLAASMIHTARAMPAVWTGLCCLWSWPWLSAHDLAYYPEASLPASALWWGWMATFFLLGAVLLGTAITSRRRPVGFRAPLVAVASTLMAGSSLLFLFLSRTNMQEGPLSGLWWLALFAWPVFAAVGQAVLFVGWGRVLGSLDARRALFQGIVATLVGALATWLLSHLDQALVELALLVLPLGSGLLLMRCRSTVEPKAPRNAWGDRLKSIPWKLLTTTFVMGCAFGILQSQALSGFYDEVAWAAVGVPSFFMAAFLLFASALWFRLDFNRMIYKIGFFTMAMGFLLVFLGGSDGVVGYAVLCTGYRYSDLLLWGLCAYLMYRRGYDAPWVIGLSMGPLLLGRCAGFLTVTVLSWGDIALAGLQNVAVVMGFVLLTSALFIENRNNLVEAWGSERLGDTAEDERVRELCCSMLAETHALSPRETEILGYLAQGMTRKGIGEKLVLSGETVKTHIQHIYEKCGVHSRQELLDLVESVSRDLGMRDER